MTYSGAINQKIEILSFEDVNDGSGGTIPQSLVYWATNAEVRPLRSARGLQANSEELKPAFEFTVRFRDDKNIDVDMQLRWRNELFVIQSAEIDYVYKRSIKIVATALQLPVIDNGGT